MFRSFYFWMLLCVNNCWTRCSISFRACTPRLASFPLPVTSFVALAYFPSRETLSIHISYNKLIFSRALWICWTRKQTYQPNKVFELCWLEHRLNCWIKGPENTVSQITDISSFALKPCRGRQVAQGGVDCYALGTQVPSVALSCRPLGCCLVCCLKTNKNWLSSTCVSSVGSAGDAGNVKNR